MAKRSDFAQKLLDDLRLRKEQHAASQSSDQMEAIAADNYAYSSRNSRESLVKKTHDTTLQIGNTQTRSSGVNKLLANREPSNQIVSFRGDQRSRTIDLSTALAFAIENAGKATRLDPADTTSILGFLHQIGKRSMNHGKMEGKGSMERHQTSSGHLPTLHLQIKEISNGAQKLNQIIKTCTTSLSFGRYSIEYGKELMKGATDLEESLQMLVDIQGASEYIITPKRQSQIKLLNDNNEDVDDQEGKDSRYEQRQLELPRFSFDKPSRYYQNIEEVARADIKMRLAATSCPSETNHKHGKQAPDKSKASSHRRSVSYSYYMYPEKHNKPSSSQSNKHNGRIPNVIAKLMGLGELPEDGIPYPNDQKDPSSRRKTEELVSNRSAAPKARKTEQKKKEIGVPAPQNLKHQVLQAKNAIAIPNLNSLQAGMNLASQKVISDVLMHDGITWKDLKNKSINQNNIREKEGEGSNANYKRENAEKHLATTQTAFKEAQSRTPHMHRRLEVAVSSQEDKEYKSNMTQTGNIQANKQSTRNQERHQNDICFKQKPPARQKSEPRKIRLQNKKQRQECKEIKIQESNPKGSVPLPSRLSKHMEKSINLKKKQWSTNQPQAHRQSSPDFRAAIQLKVSPEISNLKSQPSDVSYNKQLEVTKNLNRKSSHCVSSPKEPEPELAQVDTPSNAEEEPFDKQAIQKSQEETTHKREIPCMLNKVIEKNQSSCKPTAPMKYQISSLQEVKEKGLRKVSVCEIADQERISMSKDPEAYSMKFENFVGHIQASIVTQAQKEVKKEPLSSTPGVNKSKELKESETLFLKTRVILSETGHQNFVQCQVKSSTANQAPESVNCINDGFKLYDTVQSTLNGSSERSVDTTSSAEEQHKLSKPETSLFLTESENYLKHIVTKSQLFLDTAKALLKLNIPYGILHSRGHDHHEEESKLKLDCSYELMKRKGRRQELSLLPYEKVPISSPKVKSLDDLVRELNEDLRKLRSYGRYGYSDLVEDYLPKMLETDVHFTHPDLVCMWDMGWNHRTFAFIEKDDIIRDMERYMINGLLDELTVDLVSK